MKSCAVLYTLFLLCLLPVSVRGQAPPSTDILLLHLDQDALKADVLRNLTQRVGYDNQPAFTPDGQALLYTSYRDDGQTDIYRIDLETYTAQPLTQTAESEYSPTVTPQGDTFSVIRVEADGTQRLWQFQQDGSAPSLVLEEIKPVGYHAWADAQTLALFVLGTPPTLQLADTRTGQADTLAYDIGRSLHRVPGTATVSFVHKETEDAWIIKILDPASRTVTPVTQTRPNREDYAWLSDGSILMGDGAVLYAWTPDRATWDPVVDLSDRGVADITRIAVHPEGNLIALVIDHPAPPDEG